MQLLVWFWSSLFPPHTQHFDKNRLEGSLRPEPGGELCDAFRDMFDSSLKFLSYMQGTWLLEAVSIFWTGGSGGVFCMLSCCSQLAELQIGFKVVEDQVLR